MSNEYSLLHPFSLKLHAFYLPIFGNTGRVCASINRLTECSFRFSCGWRYNGHETNEFMFTCRLICYLPRYDKECQPKRREKKHDHFTLPASESFHRMVSVKCSQCINSWCSTYYISMNIHILQIKCVNKVVLGSMEAANQLAIEGYLLLASSGDPNAFHLSLFSSQNNHAFNCIY